MPYAFSKYENCFHEQLFQKLTFFGFKVVFLRQFYRLLGIYIMVENLIYMDQSGFCMD